MSDRIRYPYISALLLAERYPITAAMILARNVGNVEDVDAFVKSFKTSDPKIDKWLDSNLRNFIIRDYGEARPYTGADKDSPEWMRKALEAGEKVYHVNFPNYFRQEIQHIIDYLKSEQAPERLIRLTVPQAIEQAAAWTQQLGKKKVDEKIAAEGEQVVKKYEDGYTWRKLTSQEALDREGQLMGHCVGSYWKQVSGGDTEILSLRDAKNEPHCTIELRDNSIQQIKGKENKAVTEKYHSYVRDILKTDLNGKDVDPRELANIGLLVLDGKTYELEDIKKDPKLIVLCIQDNILNKKIPLENLNIGKDEVSVGFYLEDMIQNLPRLRAKDESELQGLIEDHYDTDWHMKDENVDRLFDSIQKSHPKTYEKIQNDLKRVAEETDDEYRSGYSGKWLQDHEDEVPKLYEAASQAISDGWSVGTTDASHKYVRGIVERFIWDNGSTITANRDGMLWLNIPYNVLATGDMGDLDTRMDRRRDGFNHEFDESVAKDRFIEMLEENDYVID